MIILGIDPGKTGAVACWFEHERKVEVFRFKERSDHEIAEHIRMFDPIGVEVKAFVEGVHAFPKQGVSSAFNFGRGYGFLLGCLAMRRIPYDIISPMRWQREIFINKRLKNETKPQFKKRMKAVAQRLYPNSDVTADTADAVLIMHYGIKVGT